MTGPVDQLDRLGEERPAGAGRIDAGIVGVVDVPLDLGVDDAARQDQVVSLVPKPLPVRPVGSGSTDAEKIELITLPAMRTCIVPPFWAMGSMRPVTGFAAGWRPSAAARRRRRRCRTEKGLAAGVLANAKRLCCSPTLTLVFWTSPPIKRFWIERLTVTVELRASRLARNVAIAVGVDRDVVHAQAERDISRARRGDQQDVLGLAADVVVADLGVELALPRRPR